jgi:hypothetical protein
MVGFGFVRALERKLNAEARSQDAEVANVLDQLPVLGGHSDQDLSGEDPELHEQGLALPLDLMSTHDVPDFMPDDRGEPGVILGQRQQPGQHNDLTVERDGCIRTAVLHHNHFPVAR